MKGALVGTEHRAKRSVSSSLGAGTRIGSPRQPAACPALHATCHRADPCYVAGTVFEPENLTSIGASSEGQDL
jgi:hypothetical protein